MSTVASNEASEPVDRSRRRQFAHVAFLTVIAMIAVRGFSELAMMSEYGPDAQMAIWQFFLIGKLLFWLVTGLVVALVGVRLARSSGKPMIGLVLVGAWSAVVLWASGSYIRGWRALADASKPTTSPARLAQLVEFDGVQAGYELDNRLAANPNTPPEAIRKLAMKNQLGTQMILARDPDTPPDILQQLGKVNDKYVQDALKSNPNYFPATAAQP
jgi:hypothetical protein